MQLKSFFFGALALLLGLSQPARAQFRTYSPPPIPMPGMDPLKFNYGNYNSAERRGRGSYQLPDGSWHRASKLHFDGEVLAVKDSASGRQRLKIGGLRQFEVARDTFLVMESLPGRQTARPEFAESLLNQHGIRVLYCSSRYFVQLPGRPLQLLPTGKKEYKATVAALLAGCPAVAQQVSAGILGRNDVVETFKQYVTCLPAGGATGTR